MQRTMKRIGALILALAMLVTFMPTLGLTEYAHADEAEEIGKAKDALVDASPLTPVQWNADYTVKKDTNIITMAQAIVDEASEGVEVTEVMTADTTASRAIAEDGTITYGNSAVECTVYIFLETESEDDMATVRVSVPKNVTPKSIYMQEFADEISDDFLNNNPSADEVTSNLKISTGDTYYCITVDWTIPENASAYLSKSGSTGITVKRPSFQDGDFSCTVTATVKWTDTYGYAEYMGYVGDDPEDITLEFPITIKAFTEEEAQAAEEELIEALNNLGDIKNYFDGNVTDLDAVDQDLSLPYKGGSGFTSTWTSSDPEVVEIKTYRAYPKRDEIGGENKTARLTITISKNGASKSKSFVVTVVPMTQEELDDENEYLDKVANALSFDNIKGENINPAKIVSNLVMTNAYRGYYDKETGEVTWGKNSGNTGAKIEWATSNSVVIKTYGTITRPSGTEDADVVMTATISSQRYSGLTTPRKVEIPVTVLATETLVDLNEPPELAGDASGSDFVEATEEYVKDVTGLFTDLNTGDVLTYKASVDGGDYADLTDGIFKQTWSETGTHTIKFKANDGKADSGEYTLSLQVLDSGQAEEAAELQAYKQNKCTALENYKDPADYRRAQQVTLANAITEGKNAINAATDRDGVDDAYEDAIDEIDMIPTSRDYAIIDLWEAIDEASEFADSMEIGTAAGKYPAAAKEALLSAIQTAQDVYESDTASYNDVLQAKVDLDAAVATAKDSANAISVSVNILGQDKVNAYTKALYPVTVKSDSAAKYGYTKPAEFKHQVTVLDAIVVLHHEMYGNAFDSAPQDYFVMSGPTVTKIFGKSTINLGYYVNYEYPIYGDGSTDSAGNPLGSVAYDTVITSGDQVNVWIYGTARYKDRLLYFDKNSYSMTTDGTLDVTLYGRQAGIVGSGEQKVIEGGVVIATDAEGNEIATATTDASGKATLSITTEGEFYLTAKTIPVDPVTNDDHFVAPYAKVQVTDTLAEAKRAAESELTKLEEDSKDKVKDPEALSALIAKAKEDINKATDGAAVQKIVDDTKAAVAAMIKEKEDADKDEKEYSEAAAAATAELDKVDISKYNEADKAAVQKLIDDARKEIADAKTASAVKAAMDKFNEAMKAYDTAEVIQSLIDDAVAEIDKTIVPTEYVKKDQAAVEQLIADAKAALAKAGSRAEINMIMLKLKEDIAKCKTQAEADKEARAAAKKLKVKGLKVKSAKRRFTVSWKKTKGASGYQVQYKLKKAKKFKTLKSLTKTKVKSKKLKKGKVYSFKVRTYKKVAGKKVYGKWTKVKSVKCR